MTILIEGKKAELKSGSSFEFNFENRLFMGRDSYTLTLTFPLVDSQANRDIFGHLERKDLKKDKVFYECEIRDKALCSYGSILITGVSESEVKAQFVEGRCEQTATDPFEDVYVNELELGSYPTTGSFTPVEAWSGAEEVALPWINESYPTQFNNWVNYVEGKYVWSNVSSTSALSRSESGTAASSGASGTHRPTENAVTQESLPAKMLSWQPYLISIAKKICTACGYTYDFEDWEVSDYRYFLVCNTLPYTWDRQYKDILPHWTVSEFFEKLELLLMGEFEFDHRQKRVTFIFIQSAIRIANQVQISDVVDEYAVEISNDQENCSYLGAKRLVYKECSHSMQPFYACDWFLEGVNAEEYVSIIQIIDQNKRHILTDSEGNEWPAYGINARILSLESSQMISNDVNKIMHAQDIDQYFVFRSIGTEEISGYRPGGYSQIYVLQPINSFGSGCADSDDIDDEEIEFVPVCITDTYIDADDDMGYMMYLSFGSYEDDAEYADVEDASAVRQPKSTSALQSGEKADGSSYFDVVYVGFWNGDNPIPGKSPYPVIDSVNVYQDWTTFNNNLPNLRLTNRLRFLKKIDSKQKFKFSFLSSTVPNPRAIFYIRGKRYICEKITATFTDDGMSQLLKGEFYPIDES